MLSKNEPAVQLTMLPAYAELLKPHRYKVLLGGRAAGRSVAAMQAAIYFAENCKTKIAMLREFQNSIADSCKAQFEELLEQAGIKHHWTITKTYLMHKHTGSTITFYGLAQNYTKIKSVPNIDIAIIEEAETVSRDSIDVLIPTIRKKGSELWFLGNPRDRNAAVAQIFVENEPPPDTVVIRTTYLDNPFVSEEIIAEAEHLKRTDPVLYNHVWLGGYLDKAASRLVKTIKFCDGYMESSPNDQVVIGIDIAREGDDSTVILVRKGKQVLDYMKHSNMDLPKLSTELAQVRLRHNPDWIFVDSTGHGAWLADGLIAKGFKGVVPINFASDAVQKAKYHNRRTEMYALVQEYFEQGGTIPQGASDLALELEASYYTLDSHNRFAMIPKSEIKKLLKRSPDSADALGLTMCVPDGPLARKDPAALAQRAMLNQNLIDLGAFIPQR